MLTTSDHKHWHAVYVRHNTEFKVETWLREQGVEVYLPVQDVFREYAGKRVKVTKPVITGMVFVCLSRSELSVVDPSCHSRPTNGGLPLHGRPLRYFYFNG